MSSALLIPSIEDLSAYKVNLNYNSINIYERANLNSTSLIGSAITDMNDPLDFSSISDSQNLKTWSGNMLNIHTQNQSIRSFSNFEFINFFIPKSATNNTTLLVANEKSRFHPDEDIKTKIQVRAIEAGAILHVNDRINLLYLPKGAEGNAKVINSTIQSADQGVALRYKLLLGHEKNELSGEEVYFATIASKEVNPRLNSILEGRIAALSAVRDAHDLIESHLQDHSFPPSSPFTPFIMFEGGHSKYRSNGDVKMNTYNGILGFDFHQSNFRLGLFYETGTGNYDSKNTFKDELSVNSSGKTRYHGFGLFAKYEFNNKAYVEGSIRTGRSKISFNSNDLVSLEGLAANYNNNINYFAGHIGTGYLYSLSDKNELDLSLEYTWTQLDNKNLSIANNPVHFKKSNSNRIRGTINLNHHINPQATITAGIGYEYEFSGKAKATTYQVYNLQGSSIKGSSGIIELGAKFTPSVKSALELEVKVRGYLGARKGGTGAIQLKYNF